MHYIKHSNDKLLNNLGAGVNNSPEITVIMAVYNGEKYLSNSISSILNQTFSNFEFIIINDGSTDKSWEIITNYSRIDSRIIPINQKNKGLTKSLNIGLRLAKGKYIARQDADDISLPERFQKQKEAISKNKIIFSRAFRLGKVVPNKLLEKFKHKYLLILGNFLIHGTLFIDAKLIKEYLYDENYYFAQDYNLYLRLAEAGNKFLILSEPLYILGVSNEQISSKNRKIQDKYVLQSYVDLNINPKFYLWIRKSNNKYMVNIKKIIILLFLSIKNDN